MSDELKYEGLVALMLGVEERIEKRSTERHNDLKEAMDIRFRGLEAHNERQNGAIMKIKDRVEVLEEERKYTRIMKWVDKHPKRSAFILLTSWIAISSIVTYAIGVGALPKLWELIVK